MIKQILTKIPRKPSETSHGDSYGVGRFKNGSNSGNEGPERLRSSSAVLAAAKEANWRKKWANVAGQVAPLSIPGLYEALPSFRDVPSSEKRNLLIEKLNMCCVVFDFTDPSTNPEEKDVKRRTLLELVDHVSSANFKFNEPVVMCELTKMVAVNLFRSLPSPSHESKTLEAFDLDEEEPAMEPAWPHVQIVYELLLRFVASSETDAKLAKRFVDRSFVLCLLDLFDSEDPRERDYLKTILHQIYSKFTVYRPFIRRAINNVFYQFVFETERHNGISELLEILGSVINGFSLPLKEEHKLFLVRCLIPLHKPTCLSMYHQQLSFCVIQFVEKDVKLADTVIRGLLKYWPVTNSSKEVTFLTVLEEVFEVTHATEFRLCMIPLFRQLSRCLNSFHFQVAERTLFLLNKDRVRNLVIENNQVILPIILPALEQNARSHWNQIVQGLALDLRKVFANVDQAFFDECRETFEEDEIKKRENQEKHVSSWKFLEELANAKRASKEANLVSSFAS